MEMNFQKSSLSACSAEAFNALRVLIGKMVYRYLCQISMSQRKLCRHVSVKTRSVGNNLSMKIFLQETFVQEKFGQETFVQERFVQERFVQETFVQETFVQETFVQERFVQETKWSREPPH